MSSAADEPHGEDKLELHVRCVAGEDKVVVCLNFRDGQTVALNRSSDEDMASTLRRLSLTVQKRRRLADSKANKNGGKKKRTKGDKSGGGGVVTAGLFDKETGDPIEIDGVLNRDGWIHLCGGGESEAEGGDGASQGTPQNGDLSGDSLSNGRRNGPAVVKIGPKPPTTASAAAAAADAAAPPPPPPTAGDGEILELDVVVNPPAVTSLECGAGGLPMAGFCIVAQAEAEFEAGLGWEWLREEQGEEGAGSAAVEHRSGSGAGGSGGGGGGGGGDGDGDGAEAGLGGGTAAGRAERGRCGVAGGAGGASKNGDKDKGGQPSGSRGFARLVGTLRAYTPTAEDVGRRLMVRCTPLGANGRSGRPVVRVLTTPVQPGREPAPLALRRRWLDGRGAGGVGAGRLRVMCYNILADMYCTSEQADKVLYPYCAKEFRAMDYRMQMVAREIRGHGADLIMLQECEAKAYDRFLAPGLAFDGFEGLYLNKAGQAQEGEAIFYRSSALKLESRHDFSMSDAIPALQEFRGLLEEFPRLSTIVRERLTTVAQVAVFLPSSSVSSPCGGGGDRDGSGEAGAEQPRRQDNDEGSSSLVRLIVANTHLYFHPNAAHIRLMQMVALVERKDLIARGLRPAVVLGGDLNSPPFGPVRYLMGEVIGPDSDLWSNVGTFKWGDRFFDEISVSPDATAAVASAAPAPSEGGGGCGGGGGKSSDRSSDRPSDRIVASPGAKRPFLPGVPYLRAPLELDLASGIPPFTNFTPEFTETLDYVFIEGGSKGEAGGGAGPAGGSGGGGGGGGGDGLPTKTAEEAVLSVEKAEGGGADAAAAATAATAPMPEEATLRAKTPGLPSELFPSDHVSLVVDLTLST